MVIHLAGDYHLTMALLGMGFTSLSMAPVFLSRVKLILSETTMEECRQVATRALALPTVSEVKGFLEEEAARRVSHYLEAKGLGPEDPAGG